LRILEKVNIAVIGGTGFERLLKNTRKSHVKTPYGLVSSLVSGEMEGKKVLFLPRHGTGHTVPPHRINYRANIYALHEMGVERILATNAVGAINIDFKPGDIVIPNDFIDLTKSRAGTFYDKAPVTHVDVSEPYCPELRRLMIKIAEKLGPRMWDRAILVCTEGPRYETVAEIEMFRRLGCDIVGMTGLPEAVLARELEMCYGSVCYVSNMAAGMQERLTALELSEVSKQILPKVEQLLIETVRALPIKRKSNCPCSRALENARFK
jgi:5'-methylthioadenosine phosphorylase